MTIYVEGKKSSAVQYLKLQRGLVLKPTTYTPLAQSNPVKAKSLVVRLNQLGKVRLVA